MLQTLDPHSNFMDPNNYRQMRERQEGRYYGLGISIGALNGDLTISQVFEGLTGHEKGIRRGDVIARIETADTKGWTTEQAVGKLRGPKGTTIPIAIRRVGYDKLIDLVVPRDEVRMLTVPAAVMLDATTGYIRVTDFGENTDQELGKALRDLTQKGMKRLGVRPARKPRRRARSGHQGRQSFHPKGKLIRLHARACREFRPGLSRHRVERLPESPDDYAGQPQQRERIGDCFWRAAGSRPLAHRRRDDVRQGARAVGLQGEPAGGRGDYDGAVLHTERTPDSAAMGWHVRRLPPVSLP
jgi:hypothetical protein